MSKRAAIYVRVSRAYREDDDRVTIEVQLADCERYCQEHGYLIIARYVDKDKYRARGKLINPSGARKDRPKYRAMLKAARAGEFDVIVAWKEDRLYRGMYAALPLVEVLDERRDLSVELVTETFDRSMLEIKAAIAKMELDNIRKRMVMGRRARLERGQVPGGEVRYGYQKDKTNRLAVNEAESAVVRQVFDWYTQGETNMEIRRRLNAANVPTRRSKLWSKVTIQNILTFAGYATEKYDTTLDGEAYTIPCPAIISMGTWEKALEQRKANKKYWGRNVKEDYLCRGLVICPCGWKWGARTCHASKKYAGKWGYYACSRQGAQPEQVHPDCPGTIGAIKLDSYVWSFVLMICRDHSIVPRAIDQKIEQLRSEQGDLEAEAQRLQRELDKLTEERQWVITQARKGRISEEDMDMQLAALDFQGLALSKEHRETEAAIAIQAQAERLKVWASQYLGDISKGLHGLDVDPEELTEAAREALHDKLEASRFLTKFGGDRLKALRWAILEEKRKAVRTLVREVLVTKGADGKKVITPQLALGIPLEYASLAYDDQSLEYIEQARELGVPVS